MGKLVENVAEFFKGVQEEIRQVAWPSREELIGSVVVVFVGVAILGTYIGLVDFLFSKAARLILR